VEQSLETIRGRVWRAAILRREPTPIAAAAEAVLKGAQ
jgi:hypothetical protein